MLYQVIILQLKDMQNKGMDIGNAIKYCSENIFDLVNMHENLGYSVPSLIKICLDNK